MSSDGETNRKRAKSRKKSALSEGVANQDIEVIEPTPMLDVSKAHRDNKFSRPPPLFGGRGLNQGSKSGHTMQLLSVGGTNQKKAKSRKKSALCEGVADQDIEVIEPTPMLDVGEAHRNNKASHSIAESNVCGADNVAMKPTSPKSHSSANKNDDAANSISSLDTNEENQDDEITILSSTKDSSEITAISSTNVSSETTQKVDTCVADVSAARNFSVIKTAPSRRKLKNNDKNMVAKSAVNDLVGNENNNDLISFVDAEKEVTIAGNNLTDDPSVNVSSDDLISFSDDAPPPSKKVHIFNKVDQPPPSRPTPDQYKTTDDWLDALIAFQSNTTPQLNIAKSSNTDKSNKAVKSNVANVSNNAVNSSNADKSSMAGNSYSVYQRPQSRRKSGRSRATTNQDAAASNRLKSFPDFQSATSFQSSIDNSNSGDNSSNADKPSSTTTDPSALKPTPDQYATTSDWLQALADYQSAKTTA